MLLTINMDIYFLLRFLYKYPISTNIIIFTGGSHSILYFIYIIMKNL